MCVLVLALDTATPAITAGLVEVAPHRTCEVVVRCVRIDGRAHAELLAPGISECLQRAGASVADLSAVVAGVGPGPFTGLRVGLATATALSEALRVPSYGVVSLDAIVPTDRSHPYAAVTDARRREVYWAAYDADGRRLTDPAVHRPAELPPLLAAQHVTHLIGAGGETYAEAIGLPAGPPSYPEVGALVRHAADRIVARAPGEQLRPLYLRRPDVREPGPRKSVLSRR